MAKEFELPTEHQSPEKFAGPDAGEIRLMASNGACYAYPGEDQAALRQAFCDGAVYMLTGKLPDAS